MLPLSLFLIGSWLVVGSLTAAAFLGTVVSQCGNIAHITSIAKILIVMGGFVSCVLYIEFCKEENIKPFTSFRFR